MLPAILFLAIIGTYAAIGLAFGLWFVIVGVTRFDRAAENAPWGFRLLILPGSAALWPYLIHRIRSRQKESTV